MFRRFEKWFDALSDGWNPITVRDLRRMTRSWFILLATFVHLGVLIGIHVAGWKDPIAPELFETISRTYPTVGAMLAAGLFTFVGMVRSRLGDELFDVVPLSPKENIRGYLGTSCILSAFFFVQALPFLAFPSTLPYGLPIRSGILIVGFFIAQFATLYYLSFFIRVKTVVEAVLVFVGVCYFGALALEIPFVFMFVFVWDVVLHWLPLSFDVVSSWPFIGVASVLGVAALISFVYLVYRLSIYHFANRSESCWKAMFTNLSVYLLWSTCWAIVCFAVAFVFSSLS